MNAIKVMAIFCIALTPIAHASDAHAVSLSIESRFKKSIEPHYRAAQKELKSALKQASANEKKLLKEKQRKLQDACNAEKAALHTSYLDTRHGEKGAEKEALAALKQAYRAVKKESHTLEKQLLHTQSFAKALHKQAMAAENKELANTLKKEIEWLTTIEKTSANAGIPFNEKLSKKSKPEHKKKKKKKA